MSDKIPPELKPMLDALGEHPGNPYRAIHPGMPHPFLTDTFERELEWMVVALMKCALDRGNKGYTLEASAMMDRAQDAYDILCKHRKGGR